MTEKMVRAPEHTRKKSALPPTQTYSSFFFKGVVGMLKEDGHPNLYFPNSLEKELEYPPPYNKVLFLVLSCLGLGLGSWSWSLSCLVQVVLFMKRRRSSQRR